MKTFIATHGLVLCVSLAVGVWLGHEWEEQQHLRHGVQVFVHENGGGLTNPLLECGLETDEITIGDRVRVEEAVTKYVDMSLKKDRVTRAAVYFRDLNNGPWFGIAEREQFQPGSLLKLPIAMSLYYWDSRKEGVLDDVIDLTAAIQQVDHRFNATNSALAAIPPGVYTVRDLVGVMLRESSNDAANILAQYAGATRMERIFSDLGIVAPTYGAPYEIDVKTYGAFFRVLYNASYLGREDSEELLTTLTQTTFRDGLVAGVPRSTKVAHKYGTRVLDDGSRQLHDCGIVYADTPYILCVMTQGKSVDAQEQFIAEVSLLVYENISQ